ncbi:Receptor-like protein 2 [Forsythia ovata]|uniref:Receptor-like protein 2 n=1 Tax=Forsythia ovata TaxID=205694 RepID=A0ABD1RGW5_9LAMI
MATLRFLFLLLSCVHVLTFDQVDHDSLISFYQHISSPTAAPLNWSSMDCCQWEGVFCDSNARVTRLLLPGRGLLETITPFFGNLSSLTHLNLSHNQLSGSLPVGLFHNLNHLQTLDLSFNRLSGLLQPPQSSDSLPISIQTIDLSSNRFNGSIDTSFIYQAFSLISFNISNNSFTGTIPSSICRNSNRVKILDFSINKFNGHVFQGIGQCSRLEVFRAGLNSLSGWIPYDLYSVKTLKVFSLPNNNFSGPINGSIVLLSKLSSLELNDNGLTGELPRDIGLLSNLKQLLLHTNSLNGSLPPSLTGCINLRTLLLRNNLFGGEISTHDFSKLQQLQVIDFGNNSFVGRIPESLCLCKSLTAVRLAYNRLESEVPPCMTALTSLSHLSLSDNYLSNVIGALRILMHCDNLTVLFMSRCFHNEMMPDDYSLLHLNGFQNLQILTLGGCQLIGQVPSWIAKLRKLKVLNLSYNQISGSIPTWLGSMPDLFILNLTQNHLSGELPREIGNLPALITDDTDSDLGYLALPFLFNSLQYNSLFNLPRGIKVGSNSLSGKIPVEIGQLELLRVLELSNNNFNGSIPNQLSHLTNLEKLDMSGNHLSGEIPQSLANLHFLSSFSIANNDLQGEIPRGGQFDTFPATSFQGNPKLCGYVLRRSCPLVTLVDKTPEEEPESSWYNLPFGMGYFFGFFAVSITLSFNTCKRTASPCCPINK